MLAGLQLVSAFLYIVIVGLPLAGSALVVRDASRITLPIARRLNVTGAANLVKLDQARAKALKARAKAGAERTPRATIFDAPVTNQAVDYVATVRHL